MDLRLTAGVVLCVVAATSCGHGEKEMAAEAVVQQFYSAISSQDWERAASLLRSDLPSEQKALRLQTANEGLGPVRSVKYADVTSAQDRRSDPVSWTVRLHAIVTYDSVHRSEAFVLKEDRRDHFEIVEYTSHSP